jgi:hypothetical protein
VSTRLTYTSGMSTPELDAAFERHAPSRADRVASRAHAAPAPVVEEAVERGIRARADPGTGSPRRSGTPRSRM